MTDIWHYSKEVNKVLYEGKRYSDAIDVLQRIASGELTYIQMVIEAKSFFEKYQEHKEK